MSAGEGKTAASATEGIQESYDADVTDEFVVPIVVTKDGAASCNRSKKMIPLYSLTSVLTEQER